MRKMILLCSAVLWLASGCDGAPAAPALPSIEFVTSTLPPTSAPVATPTPQAGISASPAPTIVPIPGTTTSEINVRAEPSTASASLGTIPPFSPVQVVGRESYGYWLRILFNGGSGWARADYVQVSAEIPVVDVDSGSGSGTRGAITRGVNVRSGPGREFESLGLLNQYDIVFISRRDSTGAWIQIAYASAPGGTGWVNTEFVEIVNVEALPVLGGETPVVESAETAPPPINASIDGDTADAPLARFIISPSSARAVSFRGEVSLPGDVEDWLAFTSSQAKIVIELSCQAGAAQVELIPTVGKPVACDSSQSFEVDPEHAHLVKITPVSSGDSMFARYEIKIEISK